MQPRKTAKAHAALETHRGGLDMRHRRVLIMADGKRSLADLAQLLGQDTQAQIAALIQAGYLEAVALPAASRPAPAGPVRASSPTPDPAPAPRMHRRSIVAARLYLQGILEMQRDPHATRLHQLLRDASDQPAALEVMREALVQLPRITSPGYAQRVQQRLVEALPEDALPALGMSGQPLDA